ncbi:MULTISPECIES: phosphopantetheine-binding protein [Streptomyces]|uniref:Carrier domain-containing protein n=1 Tax=Streptomyces morookaense TaxID=1970 RepID=A0A7Y7B628_STRMO|nr:MULTISPECIES: phosphopantetheine-binding protein [Streptomyces]MCC2277092.1 phosphopantetheine-binding protein [Streptomyces sp. ET3-23]NVK79684.1 hypothetical protein [Streptomyces morookaense]GHF32230.1 hypothetical protein GCM10010359_38550 [Streptomyces morookaense]
METLNNRLDALLQERFPQAAAALAGGATFQEAGVDSMGVVEFIVTVERHFDLPMLDGNELSGTSTLDDARELIASKSAVA